MITTADKHFSLLGDGIISVTREGVINRYSLPEVYEVLVKNEVDDFPTLRPHQRHYWHAMLCQLGAIAMIEARRTAPPQDAESWKRILRDITSERFPDDEPWHLCVEDITKPAFLQPPASSEGKLSEFKSEVVTPDEFDLPVGSKHHDIRDTSLRFAFPEHWLYALVSTQTGAGFDGAGNYGISRMNGGLSTRHGFSISPADRWGERLVRDLTILSREYKTVDTTNLLLWLLPWDGTKIETMPLHEIAARPLYIEIARRIRLIHQHDGRIQGIRATSKASRLDAKQYKGMTDDPWTITETEKAVTISPLGFGYKRIANYLDPKKYQLPILAKKSAVGDPTEMTLIARAIVRGQGKTEGYHERAVPLKSTAAGMLRSPSQQAALHNAANERILIIAEVQSILGHAIKAYLQNGDGSGATRPEHSRIIAKSRQKLDAIMEDRFWTDLQEELEGQDGKEIRSTWCHNWLVPEAGQILNEVHQSNFCNSKDRYKAIIESSGIFDRRTKDKNNTKLPERPEEQNDNRTASA